MNNLTVEEQISRYPNLRDLQDMILFVERDTFRFYLNDDKVNTIHASYSITLLKKFLTNLKYYSYLEKLIERKIKTIKIAYITNGDISTTINLNRADILSGLKELVDSGELILDEESNKRYSLLNSTVSFDKYLQEIEGRFYSVKIDGSKYNIPIKNIISFMQISDDEFEKICLDDMIEELYGIKKEYFLYAIDSYFLNGNLFSNYVFPNVIYERFLELEAQSKIDFEAINKITVTEDNNLDKIVVNEELRNAILDGILDIDFGTDELVTINMLIKAIYIYIKMCKILTYDEEFCAVNQRGIVAKKHEDIKHITSITPQNNRVVCYEFNETYAKLLDEIGIKFVTTQALPDSFGGGHAYLTFRTGKFLVKADALDSLLKSDMMNAKLNQPLCGLVCKNKNKKTKYEFYEIVTKVYKYIINKEQYKSQKTTIIYQVETFDDVLKEYLGTTRNIEPVDLDERFEILIKKVNDAKMKVMDSLGYTIQLSKILFNKQEKNNNIAIRIVRNNKPDDSDKVATVSIVFVLNKTHMTYKPEDNEYYLYNPGKNLMAISRNKLFEMFCSGTLEFIENAYDDIPGLIDNGGLHK